MTQWIRPNAPNVANNYLWWCYMNQESSIKTISALFGCETLLTTSEITNRDVWDIILLFFATVLYEPILIYALMGPLHLKLAGVAGVLFLAVAWIEAYSMLRSLYD